MKYLILVGDGMADEPQDALGGKTPLEYASTPNMDALAREGCIGLVKTVPEGMKPGSDVANMALMGYDPAVYYTGRAPIEAAGMGVELGAGDTAFRCNLVCLESGRMKDYSSGAIDTADAHALIAELQEELQSDAVQFHPGVSYRHLLVIKGFPDGQLDCTPPHDITGKRFAEYLPQGAGSGQLQQLMLRARDVLAQSEINRRRRSEGNTPATDIWLWGHGAAASFPTLRDRYNLTGSVITAVDLVRGLGQLAGLTIRNVEGATGYLDTNYAGKLSAAIDALRDQDFVYLHIEAPDETSHEGSKEKKLQAIEDFDTRIVGRARAAIDALGDWRILVVPDHATLLSTMTHHAMAVPYCLSGKNIEQDEATTYSESAAAGKPLHTGPSLFERFIRE